MSAIIQVSRDSESFRIELHDKGDALALWELGPYTIVLEGNCVLCQPDPAGVEALKISDHQMGFRFFDDAFVGWHENADLKFGRFGPIELEADIYNPEGFEFELEPLYNRPWPRLRENESYDIGEQVVVTLAERISFMITYGETGVYASMKNQIRKVPDHLWRHLPYGLGEEMLKEHMVRLGLPFEA